MLPNWFALLVKNLSRIGKANRRRPRRAKRLRISARPGLELLEERLVPTTMFFPSPFNPNFDAFGNPLFNFNVAPPLYFPNPVINITQGSTIRVPIAVDTLNDPINGNIGLFAAAVVVNFNPAIFQLTAVNLGTMSAPNIFDPLGVAPFDGYTQASVANPFANNGWRARQIVNAQLAAGITDISIDNDGNFPLTSTAGGSLVVLNFTVLQNAPLGIAALDLAADTNDPPTFSDSTALEDFFGNNYVLNPNFNSVGTYPPPLFPIVDPFASSPQNGPVDNTLYGIAAQVFTGDPNQNYVYIPQPPLTLGRGFDPLDAIFNITPAVAHFSVNAPASATVNSPFLFTVTAQNADNSTNILYNGVVHFTSSDPQTQFTSQDVTLNNGVGTFVANMFTSGNQTITATDLNVSSLTGFSNAIAVSPAPATKFVVSAPSIATAGNPFQFTVIAEDQFNNVARSYGGTVTFASSDPSFSPPASLPAATTMTNGEGVFSATLQTPGFEIITATDSASASITGTSSPIFVTGTPIFGISAPANATVGGTFIYTVIAEFSDGSTNTSYNGTVTFTSSDPAAKLPADATLTSGIGFFAAQFKTAGDQTITATDTTNTAVVGSSNAITVVSVIPHFDVTAPSVATRGNPFSFTVTALDSANSVDTSYNGTVTFTSSDSAAVLQGTATFNSGIGFFAAFLNTLGQQTITASDSVNGLTGISNFINVITAGPHFAIVAPSSASAGGAFQFTVTAQDTLDNTLTGYSGTIHFTSSDSLANLPLDATLSSGIGTFSATLTSVGSQTLIATDTVATTMTGVSNAINVQILSPLHFVINVPTNATAGGAFTFTITAENQSNSAVTGYAGTVHFSTADTRATLPLDTTLTGGTGIFSATLIASGSKSLVATDLAVNTITGTSPAIAVSAGPLTHFGVSSPSGVFTGSGFNFTVIAEDSFNNTVTNFNGPVTFSSSDGTAILPAASPPPTIPGAGNLLIDDLSATSPTLYEFVSTASSQSAGTFSFVADPAGDSGPRSIVIDGNGDVEIYNGTFSPYLTTLNLTSGLVTGNTTLSGWSTSNASITNGGVAAFANFVFATDMDTGGAGAPNGIVRFNIDGGTPVRFASGNDYIQIAVGLNGLLYALENGGHVDIFDPSTTSLLKGINLTGTDPSTGNPVTDFSAIAVDAAGNIFAVHTADSTVFKFDGNGNPLTGLQLIGFNGFDDIAINQNNQLALAMDDSGGGSTIVVTDTSLTAISQVGPIPTSGTGTFVSWIEAPIAAGALTLNNGIGVFSATLSTAGSQTITATDAVNSTITGNSGAITVTSQPHFAISGPSNATAGVGFRFTVTAENPDSSVNSTYTGTVQFSSSAGPTGLPGSATLTSGVGIFSATLTSAGSQTLTATDTVTTSVTGASNTIIVSAAAATHFVVTAPSAATAGTGLTFTVTAEDQFNNVATGYAGTVAFASSDTNSGAKVPANTTLVSGVGSFSATLATMGSQTLTANDVAFSSVTGKSGAIIVSAGAATHFVVSAPGVATGGTAFSFTVTAEDQFNNVASGYQGSIKFSSSDTSGAASLPPSNSTLANGVGIFTAVLIASGSQTLTATDTANGSIKGSSNGITVVSTGATLHFVVSAPGATTAGSAFVFEVIAEDQFNNPFSGYSGSLVFTSGDTQAGLPIGGTMSGGVGFFAAIFKTAGSQNITATDATAPGITGTSNNVISVAAAANHFGIAVNLPTFPVVSGPASFASTGLPLSYTVTAIDPYGNFAPTYSGSLQFSSSDSAALLPSNATMTSGLGVFTATLQTAGSQSLTATDTVHNSGPNAITGTSSVFPVRGLVVTGFTQTPGGFTITFNKAFNPATVNIYTAGSLPDSIILATSGSQVSVRGSAVFNANDTSLTFAKTVPISGANGSVNPASGLLSAGTYTVTLRSFSAGSSGFKDSVGSALDGTNSGVAGTNFQITFTVGTPPVAVGIPDFARGPSNTDAVFLPSTLVNGSTFSLSYTNPNVSPTTGTATITFSTNATTLQANIQTALSTGGLAGQIGVNAGAGNTPNSSVAVTNVASSGTNVLVTFQSALATATSQLLGTTTPGVPLPTLAPINVANNLPGTDIPITISNGQGVTSGSFTLQYNPALLSISGVVSKLTVAGATFTMVSNNTTTGTAVFSLSSPSRLLLAASTAVTLGALLATVPISATANYGAKQLLHFSSAQLSGTSPITVVGVDAVQVVAFFGDVTDTGGPLGLAQSNVITALVGINANTTAQTIPGFAAFPNLDPLIIGDVSLQGSITPGDANAMSQQASGGTIKTIPYAPVGLPIHIVGPDPLLSLPSNLTVTPGTTLVVPVNIDTARPEDSTGMTVASLALSFDPAVFDVSAADVQLGSVPASGSGWQLRTEVNSQTGLIGVELFSNSPIQTTSGGSLVTIALHVRDTAPAGATSLTIVPYVDPSGGAHIYQTQVADAQGLFVLHTALGSGQLIVGNIQPPLSNGAPSVMDLTPLPENLVTNTPKSALSDSPLPAVLVEQVFGESARAVVDLALANASSFAQPSAILVSDSNDLSGSSVHDLALLQESGNASQTDWLPEKLLAYLGQTGRGKVLAPEVPLDDAGSTGGDFFGQWSARFDKDAE